MSNTERSRLTRLARLALSLVVALGVLGAGHVNAAGPNGFRCTVSAPISAAALNAGGTWSFEAFNGTPNGTYWVKVQWAKDPSNGGHPSTGITLDSTGYGIATLAAWWAPDGTLPGSGTSESFVAVPGDFSVHIYPVDWEPETRGTTNCKGEVLA